MVMVLGVRELAAVADVSPKVIRHSVAAEVVRPKQQSGHLRFSEDDALYFALKAAIPFAIDLPDQKQLYALVTGKRRAPTRWVRVDDDTLALRGARIGLSVDFSQVRRELRRRLALLAERGERITSSPDVLGGEAVFVGSRISVRHVGQLIERGVSLEELREDFPRLSDDDFELARLVAAIGPGPGRPRRRPPLRLLRPTKRVG